MTALPPRPPSEVVFEVEPWMVDPGQIGRQVVLQQVTGAEGRRSWILLGATFAVVAIVGVMTSSVVLAAIASFGVLFILTFLVLLVRGTAAGIRSRPSFGEPGRFVVSSDGIHDHGQDSAMHLGWRHVKAAALSADHLVLSMRGGGQLFVPLAGLDPAHDPATVLDLVQGAIDAAAPPA